MSSPEPELRSPPPNENQYSPSWRRFMDRPALLLAVLFLVTAAPGLPLLWMSRGFSLNGKIVWTILVLIWTALILWGFYLVMAWCLPIISDSLQVLRG
jgi:hypothetical protein